MDSESCKQHGIEAERFNEIEDTLRDSGAQHFIKMFETEALKMGFKNAACGPMVRSSYWADQQAHGAGVV